MAIKNAIVTGGAGFIGSALARVLIRDGWSVLVMDNISTGMESNIPQGADFLKIDLGSGDSYKELEGVNCDAVFHLAGQSSGEGSFKDPLYDLRSHVMSTFYLLDWCKSKGVSRFIYSSSMGVYGDPNYLPVNETHPLQPKSFYAASKAAAEAYITLYRTMGIDTTILRLFNVYGPGQNLDNKVQGMASIYLSYMLEDVPIIVKGSKGRFRDFVYIDDVVEACMSCFHNPVSSGKTYNVASGQKTRVEDLINTLKACFNMPDYPVEYKEGTAGDQFGIVGDNSLIARDLKWSPKIDIQTGLRNMVDSEKARSKVT